jgi:DNA-binding response OmpR family regulator
MKILLIEDDPGTLEVIKFCLEIYKPDASIICTTVGREGIKLAKNASPDAIIVDLMLPDIDGESVIRQIRLFSNVPILISSAKSEKEALAATRASGADDYIIKPYNSPELISKLDRIVNLKNKPLTTED